MAIYSSNIADYLQAQGVGTVATDIFIGYMADTPNSCIAIIESGGTEPDPYLPLQEPTFQVLIRNTDFEAGQAKLLAVRNALHQLTATTLVVGGYYFYYILAISEGGHIGRDESQRDMFSINFRVKLRA